MTEPSVLAAMLGEDEPLVSAAPIRPPVNAPEAMAPPEVPPQSSDALLSALMDRGIPRGVPPPAPTNSRQTKPGFFKTALNNFAYSFARGTGADPMERQVRQQEMELSRRQVESQEGLRRAQEEYNRQRTELFEMTPMQVTGPDGKPTQIMVPRQSVAAIQAAIERGQTAKAVQGSKAEVAGKQIESKERIASAQIGSRADLIAAQKELAEAQAAAKRGEIDPNSPVYQQKERALQARIQASQASQALQRERLNLQTQKVATGAGLTTATRTMIEKAPTVLSFIERIKPLVEKEANGLGPMAGRWSEFMAGKIGVADPAYKKLKDSTGLLSTLLMQMHVGARGSNVILKHFKDMLDTGKQSPENLLSTLEVIEDYANDLVAKGASAGGGQGGGPSKGKWNPRTGRYE